VLLIVSAGIGIYYGFVKKNQNKSTADFLMAGRSMHTFPMAMSLIASFMSAVTLLGTPSETYLYGSMYWFIGVSYFIVIPSAAYLYLPVFFNLNITSAYEVNRLFFKY
jgi:sodium-coupled monocarboxylate transporter 8/12